MNFIYIGIALLVITFIVVVIVKSNKKPVKQTEQPTEPEQPTEQPTEQKKEEPKVTFKEVPDFDEDNYISDTFNVILHSLPIDEWSLEHERDSLNFTRKKIDNNKGRSYGSILRLKVEFSFEYDKGAYSGNRIFTVKRITLHPPDSSSTFTFKGELKEEFKKYFYELYSKHKEAANASKKLKVDMSLKSINEVIGQASIRDSKLSELLGDKNEL